MTETLYHAVKEGLIDSLEHWIELRDIRNELAHDYPDNLAEALLDLKYCIDNYATVKTYYLNTVTFAKKHLSLT